MTDESPKCFGDQHRDQAQVGARGRGAFGPGSGVARWADRPKIINRPDAIAAKLKKCFTGEPCVHGHIAERRVDNSNCLVCLATMTKPLAPEPSPDDDDDVDPREARWIVKEMFRNDPNVWPNSDPETESIRRQVARERKAERRRLARGKHTCLAGEGGKGKSQIAYDLAARISKGVTWPDNKEAKTGKAPVGRVIILSAEDGVEDVMIPRLIAAGANLKNIKIVKAVRSTTEYGDAVERKFNLQADLQRMFETCEALNKDGGPPVMLIIFDPVSSYMGGTIDSNKNTQVRFVLDPITKLAEDVQCAVLSITHFNKGAGPKAVNRVMDSAAFTNAPRFSFGVFDDLDDVGEVGKPPSRLFLMLKTNFKPPAGLKYHVEEAKGGVDKRTGLVVDTTRIVWDGPTELTADEVAQSENERGAPRMREAIRFLRNELEDGPQPAAEVMERAENAGIAEETLKRAKRKMKVKAEPVKGKARGGWMWTLGARFGGIDFDGADDTAADEGAESTKAAPPFDDSDFA